MEDSETTSFSLSSLLCNENEPFLNEQFDEIKKARNFDFSENEDEYIDKLVQSEREIGSKISLIPFPDCSTKNQSWLRCARLDAIEWILHTREIFGFQFHTAYLSVIYFDRFLSKRSIDDGKLWAIRLLSIACLSLAAKMVECEVLPTLSEFPMEDFDFENKVIQRMELLVLSTLEWRMSSSTPFCFLNYFVHKFCSKSRPADVVSSAVEILMATIKEIDLVDQRPSIIAAAAVLAASNGQLTRETLELKMNLIPSFGTLEYDHVFFCYKFMQKIETAKIKTPKFLISPNFSSTYSGSINNLDNASVASAIGAKRRLSYNDDRNFPVKKINRQ